MIAGETRYHRLLLDLTLTLDNLERPPLPETRVTYIIVSV